jgi:hypothetical protein
MTEDQCCTIMQRNEKFRPNRGYVVKVTAIFVNGCKVGKKAQIFSLKEPPCVLIKHVPI